MEGNSSGCEKAQRCKGNGVLKSEPIQTILILFQTTKVQQGANGGSRWPRLPQLAPASESLHKPDKKPDWREKKCAFLLI